jgi:hypothetical protein
MNLRTSLMAGGTALALVLAAAPVAAHHGWGGQAAEHMEITGKVEIPLSFAGPHATMKIRADGKLWDLTLAPPPRTAQSGLREGIIPVGAQITVRGHRNLDPERFEMKTERVIYNGRTYNVYPPDRD